MRFIKYFLILLFCISVCEMRKLPPEQKYNTKAPTNMRPNDFLTISSKLKHLRRIKRSPGYDLSEADKKHILSTLNLKNIERLTDINAPPPQLEDIIITPSYNDRPDWAKPGYIGKPPTQEQLTKRAQFLGKRIGNNLVRLSELLALESKYKKEGEDYRKIVLANKEEQEAHEKEKMQFEKEISFFTNFRTISGL